MKLKSFILSLAVVLTILGTNYFYFDIALAQTKVGNQAMDQLNAGAGSAGFSQPRDPRSVVMEMVKYALTLLGMIFMLLVFIGGYWYLTSHGEEDKINKAKNTIGAAIIGLVIVLLSYGVVQFVSSKLVETTGYGK